MTQNINPISWGAQDRYQAHFIVKSHRDAPEESFLARPELKTKGHFASKRVTGVKWVGGSLADALNADDTLQGLMTKLSYRDAQIVVEPTKSGIRIYGKWMDSSDLSMTKELLAVYDR
ncbi:MAG: hypothetical protein ACREA5_01260, partial [Nitrosotalea sp.]